MNNKDFMEAAYRQLGTLTEKEFNNPSGKDPWICTSTDFMRPGRRDAFIGNGLIGIRIPPEGQPSVYPTFAAVKMAPGGTQMYGIWDDEFMMSVFNFMGLELKHGRSVFRRDSGAILNYRQTLDWKTGTVHTECDWVHWGNTVHVEYNIFLARHLKNLGCVELKITSPLSLWYTVIDRVDGSFMPFKEEPDYHFRRPGDPVKALQVIAGTRRRRIAAATIVTQDGVPVSGDMVIMRGGYERRINLKTEPGRTYCFRKYGSLFADGQAEDPVNAAATLVAGAMSHPETVRKNHEEAWAKLWEHDIEVPHPGLQRLIHTALYQLYSNLGEGTGTPPGPTGLTGNAWGGHLFYDGDTWTFPPMLLLNPELAKNYVDYRFRTLPGARRNAKAHGMKGAQFAWESAEFGDETIPGLVYSTQHHINSDVALAQWQYFLVTGDKEFLEKQASVIFDENAEFWCSRSTYNAEKDRYEIHQVCCPDEYAEIRNNNAMTNYSAKKTMEIAAKVRVMLGKPVPEQWKNTAGKMWIPMDEENRRIEEYENFEGDMVKQADATLVVYPWEMPLPQDVMRNTVNFYRSLLEEQKIMMSSAIDGVIQCQLGDTETGWQMLLDLLKHFRGEFLLASESPFNETISLLTGMGGMLQLIMMGYGGIRIHDDELAFENRLPSELPWMKIRGVHYAGKCFDLEYRDGKTVRIEK